MTPHKKSFRSGPYAALIAQAVQVDNVLYISGQIGMDEDGNVPTDIADQTELAYKNLAIVLAQFNSDMSNVVDETYFVTDIQQTMKNIDKVFQVRELAYGEPPETSQTLIGISALVDPRLKIEIKCVAHLKDDC
jgi:enamine deaminase RidA (YjgF/YER057c/UK114 family)